MARPLGWVTWGSWLGAGGLLLGWAGIALGQTQITGRVVSAGDGAPVPGATVSVDATTISTTTTDSGAFALRVPAGAGGLTVRRAGFLTTTAVVVADHAIYTIALRKDVLGLESQGVTGLATTLSSTSAANASAVVPSRTLNEVPTPTLETGLQGQVAGALFEQNNGGAPGGGLQVQIHGVNSISGILSPLYVVDGVIANNETTDPSLGVNRISDLVPADIATIEVLKGASASAIYGSQASSGVIIITTSTGTPGRPQWNISESIGQYLDAHTLGLREFPTLASAQSWYVNAKHDTGSTAEEDDAYIASIYAGPQNYQSQLFSSGGLSNQTNLSVSGTQGATQYFVSGLLMNDNGTMNNTGYAKQSIRTNITQHFAQTLSVTVNLNYLSSDTRRGISGNTYLPFAPYFTLSYTPQFLALSRKNPDGSWPVNPFGPDNPFADAAEIQTPQTLSRFLGGGTVNWTPWRTERQSLQVAIVGGVDLSNLHGLLLVPPTLQEEMRTELPGMAVTNNAKNNYSNYSVNLVYHFVQSANADFTTSAGFAHDDRDLTNPVTTSYNLISGSETPPVGTVVDHFYYQATQSDQSFYVQEQLLALNSTLMAMVGVTAERSTLNSNDRSYYAYPRFGVSYRLPAFADVLDDFKLRFAYGQSGNALYPPLSIPYFVAATIKPETQAETELGFDLTMFRSRAQLSATAYQARISDLLVGVNLPEATGGGTLLVNDGAMTNSGLEISLTAVPVQFRDGFSWTSTETFYRNYSVVNSLPTPVVVVPGWMGDDTDTWLHKGRSISQIVDLNTQTPDGSAVQVGDFEPSYVVTFAQQLAWKRVRLYGLFDWRRGGKVSDLTNLFFDANGLLADTALSAKRIAGYSAGDPYTYLESATFLKLREVSLSYDMPTQWWRWTGSIRVSGASVSLAGRNLFSWYGKSYTGLDPEVTASGGLTPVRGVEIAPYPPARSYFLAFNFRF